MSFFGTFLSRNEHLKDLLWCQSNLNMFFLIHFLLTYSLSLVHSSKALTTGSIDACFCLNLDDAFVLEIDKDDSTDVAACGGTDRAGNLT